MAQLENDDVERVLVCTVQVSNTEELYLQIVVTFAERQSVWEVLLYTVALATLILKGNCLPYEEGFTGLEWVDAIKNGGLPANAFP